jgi:hypothetical protein
LNDAVQAMTAFPGGSWDSESLPDVLSWLPGLKELPKSLAATHAIVGVIRLSSALTALSLTGASTDDNDEDDHDHDDENEALDAEELPGPEMLLKTRGRGRKSQCQAMRKRLLQYVIFAFSCMSYY